MNIISECYQWIVMWPDNHWDKLWDNNLLYLLVPKSGKFSGQLFVQCSFKISKQCRRIFNACKMHKRLWSFEFQEGEKFCMSAFFTLFEINNKTKQKNGSMSKLININFAFCMRMDANLQIIFRHVSLMLIIHMFWFTYHQAALYNQTSPHTFFVEPTCYQHSIIDIDLWHVQ